VWHGGEEHGSPCRHGGHATIPGNPNRCLQGPGPSKEPGTSTTFPKRYLRMKQGEKSSKLRVKILLIITTEKNGFALDFSE